MYQNTQVMGILNATPDSFYSQSCFLNFDAALQQGLKIVKEGADILDIGGESTRPGAAPVTVEEEIERTIPLITALKRRISIPISIDTRKPKVAERALNAGASLINDIEGFQNPEMREIAVSFGVRICLMHMLETPQTMQRNPFYEGGVIPYLEQWFEKRIDELIRSGIKKEQIVIDPGIGFGKTVADNLEILHNLPKLKAMGFPVLMGISRKSFMTKILQKTPADLLPPTLAINSLLIQEGVDIIRVHDVGEHRAAADMIHHLRKSKGENHSPKK